jgi:serine/threonine protein kinase
LALCDVGRPIPVSSLAFSRVQVKTVGISMFPGQDIMGLLTQGDRPEPQRRKLTQFKDFLERMLAVDPERRMGPGEALKHPFITED